MFYRFIDVLALDDNGILFIIKSLRKHTHTHTHTHIHIYFILNISIFLNTYLFYIQLDGAIIGQSNINDYNCSIIVNST